MSHEPVPFFERLESEPIKAPHFVRQDERVVWLGKPLLRAVASQATGFIVLALFLFVAEGFRQTVAQGGTFFVAAAILGIGALFIVFPMVALSRMVYVITDSGAYTRSGIFGEKVNQTTFEKITDISFNQDVLGRILGYGTLQVNTAGSTSNALTMVGLGNALQVKRLLEQAKAERYPGRKSPEWKSVDGAPTFVARSDVALVRCNRCNLLFKRPRRELGSMGTCPHCDSRQRLKEAPADAAAR